MKDKENQLRRDALAIFAAALGAANANHALGKHLRCSDGFLRAGDLNISLASFDRIFLISAGKAAVEMANAVQDLLRDRLTAGIVVTKHGHTRTKLRNLRELESGHPVPDVAGVLAAREVTTLVTALNERDLLLVAVSGGASALLPAPTPPITLRTKQRTTDLLLSSGASIQEINCVRKHLSELKGGNLIRLAAPATVLGLLASDVVGDPTDVIGSGLTAPDPTSFEDALVVLHRYALLDLVPDSIRQHLEAGACGQVPETPKPADTIFSRVHTQVFVSNAIALNAAHKKAIALGYNAGVLTSALVGEARDMASAQAQAFRESVEGSGSLRRPACLISGGETTVTVRGNGKGGRNTEFCLAGAIAIDEFPDVLLLSAGTDGSDGPTDATGAIATGESLARGKQVGLDALDYLDRNDSYTFFEALGDLIKTGPTGTNVMDIQLLMAR